MLYYYRTFTMHVYKNTKLDLEARVVELFRGFIMLVLGLKKVNKQIYFR